MTSHKSLSGLLLIFGGGNGDRSEKLAAAAIHGPSPIERCCHSQPKEQTIAPAARRGWGGRINLNITGDMRSGQDQRARGRFNPNRPFKQQPRAPQNNQTFESTGPNIKIRGSAYQVYERYLALAREAAAGGDRIAAENFYQHAEHYFRLNNARREAGQQGPPPRQTTPADGEINVPETDSREVDGGSFPPQWDGEDSAASETPPH